MGPPGGQQKPSKRGGDGGGNHHRGEEDDDDCSSSVRNLVRIIREELLVLHREQQQQQQQQQQKGGGANASDENNSDRRTKSALEKLVETHFRGGVFGGTSSSFFLCSSSSLRSSMCLFLSLSLSLLFSKILTFAASKTSLFLFRPRNVLRVGDDVFIFWRSRRVVNSGSAPSVARCDTKTAKLVQTRRNVFVGGDGVFARVSFDVRSIVFFGYEKGSVGVGVQVDAIHCRGR